MAREVEGDEAPVVGYARRGLDVAPDFRTGRVAVDEKEHWGVISEVGIRYGDEAVVAAVGKAMLRHLVKITDWGLGLVGRVGPILRGSEMREVA